ncbi:MAG: hypothetical protein COB37_00390 [Kordiimonadales bacterium]|nr:MAG: hypothetical protein COB37_00390 [Kordiimonadales bacterium]
MTYASVAGDARSYRLTNIDMLRGLVIIIMAIDHVRDFFMTGGLQDPMAGADIDPALYFTRWITHFCAPVFVFLAGTSAGLMAERKSKNELGAFLFKRGVWLILVEVFIISTAWTFAPFGTVETGGDTTVFLQVIWAIGASMLVLAGCQYLGPKICLSLGIVILLGHNLLDGYGPENNMFSGTATFWTGLHTQGSLTEGPFQIVFVYPLLPWIGVMLLGFGTAFIFQKPPQARDAFLLKAGVMMIVAFVLIRASHLYGDMNPWEVHKSGLAETFFDFMNVSKYPPSFLFLLITLGPMAIVCAYADRATGWLKDMLVMFGRVPFAFYVAHLYLIHVLSIFLGMSQGYEASQFFKDFFFYPQGYGLGLGGVYLVWLLVIGMLYPLCKWVANIKTRRKDWWLSYL